MEAEGRDKESEEEVCDFGVGAGAWGWGGCQLVLFPVDKTLRSLSLCRSLSLSYYAILSPLPPLLSNFLPLFLSSLPLRRTLEKEKDLTSSKVKSKINSRGSIQTHTSCTPVRTQVSLPTSNHTIGNEVTAK